MHRTRRGTAAAQERHRHEADADGSLHGLIATSTCALTQCGFLLLILRTIRRVRKVRRSRAAPKGTLIVDSQQICALDYGTVQHVAAFEIRRATREHAVRLT